ncbi:MAG: hypothetical protein IE910_06705 [Brevundimonas sp.]|nr:hypothetical protein [Brevundimonas sp.]
MPATAYSQAFEQEFDLQQLLARLRGVALNAVDPKAEVSDDERAWINADVVCTCCPARGAAVVRAGQTGDGRVVRQGHFRFRSADGGDGHHPECEFYGDEGGRIKGADKIDFGAARSDLTRAVGELVCRGLERGELTAVQMQDMRRWYFDTKVANRFTVVDRPEIFTWLNHLAIIASQRQSSDESDDLDCFDPVFGDLPGYQWKRAARLEVERLEAPVAARLSGISRAAVTVAARLAKSRHGQVEFDRSALEKEYRAGLKLAEFMASHGGLRDSKLPVGKWSSKGAPPALLAFSALLLFQTEYDGRAAARLFVRLTQGPQAADPRRGNIIGLNPFHDFSAWRAVKLASELAGEAGWSFDHYRDFQTAEARLRHLHAEWRATQQ